MFVRYYDQYTHPLKHDVHQGNVCTAGINYLPHAIQFSGNQPSSVVLPEDQARPLPYIARSCYLIHMLRHPTKEMNRDSLLRPKWFAYPNEANHSRCCKQHQTINFCTTQPKYTRHCSRTMPLADKGKRQCTEIRLEVAYRMKKNTN